MIKIKTKHAVIYSAVLLLLTGFSIPVLAQDTKKSGVKSTVVKKQPEKKPAVKAVTAATVIPQNAVKIGNQLWLKSNLDVSQFRNGDTIQEAKTTEEWFKAMRANQPAWCYYDFDSKNQKGYGKTYNWYALIDKRQLSPVGTHIPELKEWQELITFLGGESTAGSVMCLNWNNKVFNNNSGFSAEPHQKTISYGSFVADAVESCKWWVQNYNAYPEPKCIYLTGQKIEAVSTQIRVCGFPVRCLSGERKVEEKISAIKGNTVTIGRQNWLTKNLDERKFKNGDPVYFAFSAAAWKSACDNQQPACCYYNYQYSDSKGYGLLYNRYAVMDKRGLAPAGTHIPTDADWDQLVTTLGGEGPAAKKMKAEGAFQDATESSADNTSGFNAKPGGMCDRGEFHSSNTGFWWSSTQTDPGYNSTRLLYHNVYKVGKGKGNNLVGYSVRCLVNENKYETVVIGKQEWMTKNLDATTFRNGDKIMEAKTDQEWLKADKEGTPAWCYTKENCDGTAGCGILYNYYAIGSSRKLAPEGYHIPSTTEWKDLIQNQGGEEIAGKKIKESSGWSAKGNGTNTSGFKALPFGCRKSFGQFSVVTDKTNSYWWTINDEYRYREVYFCTVQDTTSRMLIGLAPMDITGFSVRCIKD